MPLVDVLIPVFNGAAFIRSAIESMQSQTLADICIHVVDDGSTDGTGTILAEMAALDPRIRVHTKPNGGIVEALNTGLAHCTAEFIARHDADDLAYPTRLALQLELLKSRPDIVATGASARHINTQGTFMGSLALFPPTDQADPQAIPAKEPYLLHPFLMIRREALVRVGGYRHVVHAEDADLYWRLQEQGYLFSDKRVLGEYRMHADSISSQSVRNGRVMALSSQLCALSAVRRRSGKPDLQFSPQDGAALKAASGSLDGVCTVGGRDLARDEARHLRFATGVKLLEMAGYRPYELELSDCQFLSTAFKESAATLAAANRGFVDRTFSGTAARLASRGLWAEARALLQPGMRRPFLVRLLLRKALPPEVHRRMRKAAGPIMHMARS